jgi:hypothetical protein
LTVYALTLFWKFKIPQIKQNFKYLSKVQSVI